MKRIAEENGEYFKLMSDPLWKEKKSSAPGSLPLCIHHFLALVIRLILCVYTRSYDCKIVLYAIALRVRSISDLIAADWAGNNKRLWVRTRKPNHSNPSVNTDLLLLPLLFFSPSWCQWALVEYPFSFSFTAFDITPVAFHQRILWAWWIIPSDAINYSLPSQCLMLG